VAAAPKYKRVVLKLSGGAFAGEGGAAIEPSRVSFVAAEVAAGREAGAQVAVVVGGGNVVRGREAKAMGWPQAPVDYMGMLATGVNALALKEGLTQLGVPAVVLSAFELGECCEPYRRDRALELMEEGTTIIFAGGTGRPFFSTDTAAALRACELGADAVLKGTDVPGVFDRDPDKDADAKLLPTLSYFDVITKNMAVMDAAAAALCRDHDIPLVVFHLYETGNVGRIIQGEKLGTLVG
jgi:uridylate kinase